MLYPKDEGVGGAYYIAGVNSVKWAGDKTVRNIVESSDGKTYDTAPGDITFRGSNNMAEYRLLGAWQDDKLVYEGPAAFSEKVF